MSHPYTIIVIERENKMLYVIKRNWNEWVEAFSTLAEAQIRFDELAVSNPSWNLQILAEKQE